MVVDRFLDFLALEKRYSPHTVEAYRNDLSQFVQHLAQQLSLNEGESPDFSQVAPAHLRSWIVSLVQEGYEPRSINRKIASLKTFFYFLRREGLVSVLPTRKIVAMKTTKPLPSFIREEEMETLLQEVDFKGQLHGARNKLIVELLYGTGMRVSELTNVKKVDINWHQGTIKILGKGNKERLVPMHDTLQKALKEYLAGVEGTPEAQAPYLICTPKGKKAYAGMIYQVIVSNLGKVTAAEKKSPHTLRHTFATHLLNHGADLNAIKELLGHASLAATQVYTHQSLSRLKKIHEQAHPKS